MSVNLSTNNQKSKLDSFTEISLDSCKARIPMYLVKVIDNSFIVPINLVNSETGEIIGQKEKEPLKIERTGITARFASEHQTTNKGVIQEYFVFYINSKMLKERYFEGITENNISIVYDYLMSLNVDKIAYEAFIQAECTDIDFKKDGTITETDFKSLIHTLKEKSKQSGDYGKGARVFNQKLNLGIQFSDRKTTSFATNPYLKLYYKTIELKSKSKDFATNYLSNIDYSDRARIETTIKNKKHLRSFGIENSSLGFMLNLSNEIKENVFKKAIEAQLEPRIKVCQLKKGLKGMNLITVKSIVLNMDSGYSFETIKKYVLEDISNRSQKSQLSKKLDSWYNEFIEKTSLDIQTKKLDEFYNFIGWN